jgi:hypothetical protein
MAGMTPKAADPSLAGTSHSHTLSRLIIKDREEQKTMKRTFTIILAALAAAALFGGWR